MFDGLSRLVRSVVAGAALLAVGAAMQPGEGTPEPRRDRLALMVEVEGPIGPATADHVHETFETAGERDAALVILRMDTPGGLADSMRVIIRAILASDIPVVTYVAPSGARAASAGTYILYASHVAAMAPGTHLGAATPVQLGGSPMPLPDDTTAPAGEEDGAQGAPDDAMGAKMVSDAAAYIRGLADLRGRNAEWAERAVREAASLTAREAVEINVIDVVAVDLPTLLDRIDGKAVTAGGRDVVLDTEGLAIERVEPSWPIQLLAIITNPNVAFILMMLGVYGLIFELANPGALVPGVVGGISLILGLYALSILPLNGVGVALLGLGIALMIAEAFAPSFGVLGIGGAIAFAFGASLMFDDEVPGLQLAWPVIVGTTVVSAGLLAVGLGFAWRAHRRPVVTGAEGLREERGEVLDWSGDRGQVRVAGERWQATAKQPLVVGQAVRVVERHGLTLVVEPTETAGRGAAR